MSPPEYVTYNNITVLSVEKKLKLRPKIEHGLDGEKQI